MTRVDGVEAEEVAGRVVLELRVAETEHGVNVAAVPSVGGGTGKLEVLPRHLR
jgi:hypothetical protein